MQISISKANNTDLNAILNLFVNTIKNSSNQHYTEAQRNAWAQGAKNIERWQKAIKTQYFILAKADQVPIGFASLQKGNYIDFLFVHHQYMRQGIAQKLYNHLLKEAQKYPSTEITSDVSQMALSFFEKQGFTKVKLQTKLINNVEITNYKMILRLD